MTPVAVLSTARFGVTTDVRERLQVASYSPHSQAPGQHNTGREVGRTELGVGEAKQTACPVQQWGELLIIFTDVLWQPCFEFLNSQNTSQCRYSLN